MDLLIDDDVDHPLWLTSEFLEHHLQKYYGCSIKVKKFKSQSATAAGENFASFIYRVKVEFIIAEQLKIQRMIVKAALSSGIAFETLSSHNVYNKEIEFYSEIVPKINEMLIKLNDMSDLAVKTFGVCKTNKVMLFEDLKPKGYAIASIQHGFNLSEAKDILKKLATFHGICAVLQEQDPNIFDNFKNGAMSRKSDAFHTFYYAQLDVMIEVLSSWPNFEKYAVKLRRIRNDVVEMGCKMFDVNPNQFNTLNHGDFWLNNIMVKPGEDQGTFENVMFIDYQDSCWTSPAIDLHYFLSTSLNESLRPNSIGELIEFYYDHLSNVLLKLKYQGNIPTKEDIFEQFNERQFYGFLAACTIQPFMINESTEEADLEALVTDNERSMRYRRNMYKQPKIQSNLQKLIPLYDQMGIFDRVNENCE